MTNPNLVPNVGLMAGGQGPSTTSVMQTLLHDVTRHPAVQQHHLLAYLSRPVADTKGHTEIDFLWQKNSSEHTTFSKWLTG